MTVLYFGGVATISLFSWNGGMRQASKINFMSHPSLLMLLFLVLTWSAPF